ncbi:hypothetical protein LTR04_006777 [Oleoguttula sp. CCFEE 6159]|nr:hypothetical protein LTR04_006777 [Oleoguttula sp. CCFEE 6159]
MASATIASPSAPADLSTLKEARSSAQAYLQSRLTNKGSTQSTRQFSIPVIDLSPSFSPSPAARQAVATQIRDACTNSGFFYITSHGIPASTCSSALQLAERFFKTLPPEKKELLHVKHSTLFRGWEPSEYTNVNPADWEEARAPETKEGFNWGYEEAFDLTGGDGQYVELDGSKTIGNVWPAEEDLPGFYEGVKEYYGRVLELARHLFRLFALSLDLRESHFDAMATHPGGIARLLYYPPSKRPRPLDYECFTLLLSSASPGLEILSPDNHWTSAPPVEGSLIVNVADFMMRWTNGVYKSTVHRVVNRTTEERYSIPFFFSIKYDQLVKTLPSCISEDNPSKYPPIRAGEYVLERLKATTKDG